MSKLYRWLRRWVLLIALWGILISIMLEIALRLYVGCCYVSPLPSGTVGHNDILPNGLRSTLLVLNPNTQGTSSSGVTYHINTLGYRDDPLNSDAQHVVFLGDSTTFGLNIAHGDTYPEIWERLMGGDWQAVNTAVPGMGTVSQYAALENALQAGIQTRAIVLGFFVNDPRDNIRDLQNMSGLETFGSGLYTVQFIRALTTNLNRLDKFQIESLREGDFSGDPQREWESQRWVITRDYLGRIQQVAAERDIPFIVIYIPANVQDVANGLTASQIMTRWVNESGVTYIDGLAVYRAYLSAHDLTTPPDAFYSSPGDMGHPSPLSSTLLAEALYEVWHG